MKTKLLVLITILCLVSCKESNKIERENEPAIYGVESEDKEMNAAIEKANQTLNDFNIGLSNPKAQSQALKVAFTDSNGTEHMWVGNVEFNNGKYSGILNNDPEFVTEYKAGDKIDIDSSKISDWMYIENGKLFGGYTIKVLRNRMTYEERKQFDAESGMQID
ncbi:DUF2314 domain-containing protein [Flavobacterium sp. WLB]|uniref:YegJ family protein n=1 Tax=unclassified Flavobacterium TaxID=196869 RepID=UPI0006ABE864|nr:MULTISPECIES: DUF2314 domain-containing protein [unclassified Flavobacterium]OWU89184.1 hypothetical protein APR43_18455 [Flavobacterium sp. NLM]PUU68137.1 DUF2314 domain-containing protein [Flavobacterium sp. WLB]